MIELNNLDLEVVPPKKTARIDENSISSKQRKEGTTEI